MTRRRALTEPLGFTLVEVMLALTLFALLATILYGAIALSHGAVEKSQRSFANNQNLRSAVELLGNYVRSSYPYRLSQQEQSFFYQGEGKELTFVSSFSLAMGGRGMAKIHLIWEGQKDGDGVLKLEEQVPVRLGGDGGSGFNNGIVLRERVANFSLTYLNPLSEKEEWVERWDPSERKVLPRAVRLNFHTDSEGDVEWVFPVMMSVLAP